ncbi:DUF2681 domain-containing protein [Pasteurella skyensis]|uniref:DUF2681 domain-containing protein n=1 Tax=Phocoenobacter skyensis TaxID=97481 RepID=A0AAJ6P0H4_9PAST|nr:DUF2681 domain-containing protein [Pasteurella skyensis]MDP8162820.1 DUF2681 domain-containing protein [Pasteurella skyensis]MDP8172593.1 DUF2681 domain-containing protein [Pasteurella skyensis]MDP8179093.1 DUF2681 domain-containing protein [Pasteurella skyensis]MDP8183222.1 DUF2681 domain-containing protein [Pasteurella skyensis]MDP8189273.1 DUF2681 domain-containing protein [Pasteurella skyensis]
MIVQYVIGAIALAFAVTFVYASHLKQELQQTRKKLDKANYHNNKLQGELKNAKIRKNIEESDRLSSDDNIDKQLHDQKYYRD